MPEDKVFEQANPPNVARGDSAIWRRPDGTVYRKAAGGYGWTPHTEKKKAPAEGAESEAQAAARKKATTTAGETRTTTGRAEKRRTEQAQRETERAETVERAAPWLLEERSEVEGGLGGAAERARERRSVPSAQEAGDAMANRKKKKEKE